MHPIRHQIISLMKRVLLHDTFTPSNVPSWPCPECGNTSLQIQKGSFKPHRSKASRDAYDHDDWQYEWDRYVYSCLFECTRPDCGEVIASSGQGFVEEYYDNDIFDIVRETVYRAEFFTPPLPAFHIPLSCPDTIRTPLVNAFSLFLTNPDAAANSIRIAIEELLTHLKVPSKETKMIKGKPEEWDIPLGARLRKMIVGGTHPKYADKLMTLKDFGNAGSHKLGNVELEDVDAAFEIVNWTLSQIFDDNEARVQDLTSQMNNKYKRK